PKFLNHCPTDLSSCTSSTKNSPSSPSNASSSIRCASHRCAAEQTFVSGSRPGAREFRVILSSPSGSISWPADSACSGTASPTQVPLAAPLERQSDRVSRFESTWVLNSPVQVPFESAQKPNATAWPCLSRSPPAAMAATASEQFPATCLPQ